MKRIFLTVTNDLTYDQRMQRICTSLAKEGYEVRLIGRVLKKSVELTSLPFDQKRLKCFINKGKLFYLEYNIRLFFYLLFSKFDAVCSIDLDTILPGYYVTKFKRKHFIYDAHEYFTEVPELVQRPKVKKIWEKVAHLTIPNIKNSYTVCESLAELFHKNYKANFQVIRNVPFQQPMPEKRKPATKILLYQGALNDGRGLEEMIEAMEKIDDAQLWLAGEGDLSQSLRDLVNKNKLANRVKFLGYIKPDELKTLTLQAYIGLNLLQNKGLNYYYSLANKSFDYIQAGLPSINMNFPEYQRIDRQFNVSLLIDDLKVETLIAAVNSLVENEELYNRLRDNCFKAREEFIWEKEELKLIQFYNRVFNA